MMQSLKARFWGMAAGVAAAVATLIPASSQASGHFTPPFHGGSAGFYDVQELVSNPGDIATAYAGKSVTTLLAVPNNDDPVAYNALFTTGRRQGVSDASIVSAIAIDSLHVDSMGNLTGFARMVILDGSDGVTVLASASNLLVTGRMRFNENWRRNFPEGDFVSIDGVDLERRLNHQLRLRGRNRDGMSFNLTARVRATVSDRMDVGSFEGRLTTSASGLGSGRSDVVISNLRDVGAYWEIDGDNVYPTNRAFVPTRWEARSQFFSPFPRDINGDIIPIDDIVKIQTNWYDVPRARPGKYSIDYRGRVDRGNYRLTQKGYLTARSDIEGAAIAASILMGDPVDLAPLVNSFFDRSFRMTGPASRTNINTKRVETDLVRDDS